ncbi:putative flavin-nucleotide-binding protein [Candidatus Methanoperedens nitroreducens]|uniref:Putative flavin-nucleotide-binding protein n=1 Tax=Candidatus Methanoperedens nitratireducens TaxID=1392998 RepID=A0A062VEE6_9EURY|nr:pyridoxamine 5'-phosphate oxidase family protein [Candidatus Methanoperedens nitroreducens]KCZ73565.1 putative flavin-nucleotide-binding protein [Candidatus Methanoperedens nitroreducens]MDJ1422475.1 pyridoxamine 5'-phosphate oxidase family protein [Candidatus Methanoperedens sp.]
MHNDKKEMKWIYEEIVGRIPPFSLLSYKYSILLQLFFLLILGITLGFIFNLKTISLLYGSTAVLVAVLWSLLILQLGPTLRRFRAPLSKDENRLLERYKEILFHRNHYEIIPGIAIFILFMIYLFYYGSDLLEEWLGENPSSILLLFISLLIWDLCYRMGLGIWTSILALWRSVELNSIAEERTELEHTPYTELRSLRRLDINNVFFGIISLLLIPLLQQDQFLVAIIILFTVFIILSSVVSADIISKVPWLPPDIYNLVKEASFAYVGTSFRGIPHTTPVVYVFDGQSVFFNTSKEAKKLKILRNNNKIAFLIDKRDMSNIYENKAVLFTGEVKIYGLLDIPLLFSRMLQARRLFMRKYPEYTRKYSTSQLPRVWQLTPLIARILIEVKPTKIIYWRGAKQISVPV